MITGSEELQGLLDQKCLTSAASFISHSALSVGLRLLRETLITVYSSTLSSAWCEPTAQLCLQNPDVSLQPQQIRIIDPDRQTLKSVRNWDFITFCWFSFIVLIFYLSIFFSLPLHSSSTSSSFWRTPPCPDPPPDTVTPPPHFPHVTTAPPPPPPSQQITPSTNHDTTAPQLHCTLTCNHQGPPARGPPPGDTQVTRRPLTSTFTSSCVLQELWPSFMSYICFSLLWIQIYRFSAQLCSSEEQQTWKWPSRCWDRTRADLRVLKRTHITAFETRVSNWGHMSLNS